jgi:N-acetylglucosaminyl-diphospho-decaprenol L-rhamnosyltransferase
MIAVITVSHGSDAVLDPFLASISTASRTPVTVVVVDNKPDGSAAREIAAGFGARYLTDENRGYGHGINAGVASLTEPVDWILVCNPDLVLEPGSIDVLRGTGETDAAISAVGPRILNSDGTTYASARSLPSIRTGVGHALFANVWESNPWTRRYLRDAGEPRRRDAGWLSGACLLIRHDVFESLRGFDEGYFMFWVSACNAPASGASTNLRQSSPTPAPTPPRRTQRECSPPITKAPTVFWPESTAVRCCGQCAPPSRLVWPSGPGFSNGTRTIEQRRHGPRVQPLTSRQNSLNTH